MSGEFCLSCLLGCVALSWPSLCYSKLLLYCCSNSLKVSNLLLLAKNKNPLMKPLTLSKNFPYLLNFPLINYNLVTYLALYKEDTKPHINTLFIPLSPPYSKTSFTLLLISLNISILLHLSYKNISS